jgi:hypothetical protein
LNYNSSPFGKLAGGVLKVEAYGENGIVSNPAEALYFAVYLEPSGIVLIPADDELDPITAYAADATWYGPTPKNPLYDSIGAGIAEMVKKHKSGLARSAGWSDAREKWVSLQEFTNPAGKRGLGPLPGNPDTIRVSPFLQTKWNQEFTVTSKDENLQDFPLYDVFNYYTPNRYPAGCGAVMMAQMMKHFTWPTAPISNYVRDRVYTVKVDDVSIPWDLRGGDGNKGSYKWASMPNEANNSTTQEAAESVGALVADAAVVIGSEFAADGTASYPERIADELMTSFGYANATLVKAGARGSVGQMDINTLLSAVNSNLDARKPVGLGIFSADGGHGVVTDGYGYSYGSIYHHVNMGWGGSYDLWYNLPEIFRYNIVDSVIYNVYTQSTEITRGKEIISGRVVTSTDQTPDGALVTVATPNGLRFDTTTSGGGKFVVTGAPSNTTFTIYVALGGHSFPITEVTTGESRSPSAYNNYTSSVGNVWDVVIQEDKTGGTDCGVAAFPAVFLLPCAALVMARRRK